MSGFISLFQAAVVFGTVIMFGAVGEIITEKSGNLNLGVPGIMFLGGIASLAGTFLYQLSVNNALQSAYDAFIASGGVKENFAPSGFLAFVSEQSTSAAIGYAANGWIGVIIAFLCAFLVAAFGGFIFAFLTITLRANQNVTGLTLTIFGSGVANFFGGSLNTLAGGVGQISVETTSRAFRVGIPFLSDLGVVGELFFSYGWLVYVALIVAIFCQYYLTRTRTGLNLRAVGENPATADAAGINVTAHKYLATCLGAGISGLGGLFYVMDYTKGTWANDGTIEALGWLAVALVIFATWRPKNAIWGAYLFGVLYWAYLYIGGLTRASQEIFKMLPYIVTIVVLIFISLRKKKENQPPAALGLPYFREDR